MFEGVSKCQSILRFVVESALKRCMILISTRYRDFRGFQTDRMRFILLLTLPLYVLDQLTKWMTLEWIPLHGSIPVIPGFFSLVHVYNTGAAFGMLKGFNPFFVGLSVVALVVLVVLARRRVFRDLDSKWAAALLAAGVLGNLTDRLVHGHVVDFLDFILPLYGRWPAFNIADSCISVAAVLFIFSAFREQFSPGRLGHGGGSVPGEGDTESGSTGETPSGRDRS